jgi:hypothetical protein
MVMLLFGAVGLDQGHVLLDHNGLRDVAELEREVHAGDLVGGQSEAAARELPESRLLAGDLVVPRQQQRNGVIAELVGRNGSLDACVQVGDRHLGVGDDGVGWVPEPVI